MWLEGNEYLRIFNNMIERLDKIGYKGSLMLEVFNHTNPEYMEYTEEEFLKIAHERICKNAEL